MFKLIKKLFIIILLTSTLFQRPTYCHVTIQIEPDDLQRFADILMQIGETQQHQTLFINRATSRSACILSSLKGLSRGVFQMVGILLTLVGANLLTTKLEPFVGVKTQAQFTNITASKMMQPKICHHDYGCDENLCWRSCGGTPEEEERQMSWCYTTSSKSDKTGYQKCTFSYECSPCWDCLSQCTKAD